VRRPFVESAPLSQARSRLDRLTFAETHFVTTDFLLFNMRDLCRAALKKTVFFIFGLDRIKWRVSIFFTTDLFSLASENSHGYIASLFGRSEDICWVFRSQRARRARFNEMISLTWNSIAPPLVEYVNCGLICYFNCSLAARYTMLLLRLHLLLETQCGHYGAFVCQMHQFN
jgi:hypothetical protein